MPFIKNSEFTVKQLTGPLICLIFLVSLPLIFLIPSSDIVSLLAKANFLHQFNANINGTWLVIEVAVCCFAVFLCWSIVEIHRQRCNKFFQHLLVLANEVDLTSSEHSQDDALLKESIKLVEQTIEGYAMLLLMLQKNPPKHEIQDSPESKELNFTDKGTRTNKADGSPTRGHAKYK